MVTVYPGRYTTSIDGAFVVFLIGFRINRLLALRKWLPVARAMSPAHLPAWKAFNRSVGSEGTVGIWHETYQVAAGRSESICVNMPRSGLAVAGTHEPATGRRSDARSRMQHAGVP